METITIYVYKDEVYEEVAKATDYTGSKLIDGDENARDRILAADDDLATLSRFWEECVLVANERLKEILISGATKQVLDTHVPVEPIFPDTPVVTPMSDTAEPAALPPVIIRKTAYEAKIEVSKAFDKELTASVESTMRSFFIASIIGQWFKFANKGEASDYFSQGAELMDSVERLLYSRKRPTLPKD